MTNDVEKRWRDPPALRAAIGYVAVIVILAAGALTAFVITHPVAAIWSFGPSAVLFGRRLGCFRQDLRDWRAFRTWPIWHGAGWFLLTLALAGFALPTMTVTT